MKARRLNAAPAVVSERQEIERRFKPSARDWFPLLSWRLNASRPVLQPEQVSEDTVTVLRMRRVKDKDGKPARRSQPVLVEKTVRTVVPAVYGPPTFRNVVKDGEHV